FIMHMTGAPGVGLDESRRVAIAAERALGDVPGVRSVTQFIGRTPLAEDSGFGVERSELLLRLDAGADAAAVTEEARARAGAITGFAFDVKQFLNERIEETIEGAGAAIVVRLRGTDLVALDEAARRLADRLATIPGAVDVHADAALAAPGVRIRPRRDDMLRLGATAAAVERAVRSALGGLPVARIVRPDWQADVVVRVSGADDPARLVRLPVAGSGGPAPALRALAPGQVAPPPPALRP